ncbi:sugar phosphate isomerase/epimerase [Aestuariicella hydrocarbonica]|uniref:Sugar phosphate isomerase/epimerase n=1 Tax=Pseudomaricurvus hydrocarbonicus TaxID=1470433 RepID=A0A9E5MNI5_9GAMM|nr:TIM barrel protein [Aestuariicella hydrocarbonica]NHO67462.1 sugar phosphate isomerase/epimerase [Aestuariicella hydrocarbonica]
MKKLGIELLSIFDLPPVEFIQLAADLNCLNISLGLSQFPVPVYNFEPWSLRDNKKLRTEVKAALQDTGVTISLGEGFGIREGRHVSAFAQDLELMAELGATRVNTVGMDPNLKACVEQLGCFAEMAAAQGMAATVEFAPGLTIDSLETALEVVEQIAHPNLRLLVDSMHFFRSGGSAEQLAAVDKHLIGYVQLSDALAVAQNPDYMREATFERKMPGAGELPLQEFLAAVPDEGVVSLEIPNLAQAKLDGHPAAWLQQCVEAARALMSP